MKKLPYLLLLVLLLSSCASIQRSKDEGNIERVSELINTGQAKKLTAMTELPFLLDQEIIVLAKDVATFWSTIVKSRRRATESSTTRWRLRLFSRNT
jgi:hypothetical protein